MIRARLICTCAEGVNSNRAIEGITAVDLRSWKRAMGPAVDKAAVVLCIGVICRN